MNKRILEAAAVVALLIGAIWAASAWGEAKHKVRADRAEQAAALAKGQAQETRKSAELSDQRAAVSEAAKQSADAIAATAKRELAALRAGLTHKPPFSSNTVGSIPAVPAGGGGTIPSVSVEGVPRLLAIIDEQNKDLSQLKALVASEDSLIEAQDAQIKARDTQIQLLTVSRDQWKATAGHLQDQADAQALAAAEWRKAVGAGERRAGIKWGLIGMGVGFLAGRR